MFACIPLARLTRLHWIPCALVAVFALGSVQPARAALPTDFADQLAVSGLNEPVAFAFLPDGRMLIVEQATHLVRLAVNGTPTTILNVPEVNTSGGERGLLGLAVDPRWPSRPYVYLMHSRTPGNVSYIVRYRAGGDLTNPASTNLTLTRRLVLLADIPDLASNHNGGTLHFAPDGMLYASLGEDADPCGAQDLTQLKGCILRLKVDALSDTFGITVAKAALTPPDNPWVGMASENAKLQFAKGLRNPYSFSIDPVDGLLYVADVGQSVYEELNECVGGENFGWPQYEGPGTYSNYPGGCPATAPTAPVASVDRTALPNAAIVGAPIYHPVAGGAYSFPMEYNGDCFYGEYYSGWIRHIRRNANKTWQAAALAGGQPNATDWGTASPNVSSYVVGPDGALYYCKQFGPSCIRRIVYTGSASGVSDQATGAGAPRLEVFPNPVPPGAAAVRLQFRMAAAGPATLVIYDVSGRHVRTLRQGDLDAGPAEAHWDATDDRGRHVAPGVYFARLATDDAALVARVVVSRR